MTPYDPTHYVTQRLLGVRVQMDSPNSAENSPSSQESRPKQSEHRQAPEKKAYREPSPSVTDTEQLPLAPARPPPPHVSSPTPLLDNLLTRDNLLAQEQVLNLSGKEGVNMTKTSLGSPGPAFTVVSQDGTVRQVCRTSRKT